MSSAQKAPSWSRSVLAWLLTTDHKAIGTLYLGFAIVAGTFGGAISGYMRLELAHPGMHFVVNGQAWNALITAHGLIMIFYMVMPALIGGFGNWFVPLMIGARDMAFPGLNSLGDSGCCRCHSSCCWHR